METSEKIRKDDNPKSEFSELSTEQRVEKVFEFEQLKEKLLAGLYKRKQELFDVVEGPVTQDVTTGRDGKKR